jgi:hypothetical protein
MRQVLWMLQIALIVYLGFGAFLFLAQRGLMYFPVPENTIGTLPIEHVEQGDVQLKLWVVNPGQAQAVIYFGGNAEDVYYNADDFAAVLPEHTVYLVNYRGYGGSGGDPSETALFADALAIFDQLQARHGAVSVMGRSLGSGVATYLASRRPVERLLLVTPPDSAVALARRFYPVYPVGWLLKDRYESVRHAEAISAPVLMLVAGQDRIVPREHSERLAAAFADGQVVMRVIDAAGHNGISGYSAYWRAIREFLADGGVE